MNNLYGTDLSQSNLPPAIGIEEAADEKMNFVPETILNNPEIGRASCRERV